jgi:hypothetical protein
MTRIVNGPREVSRYAWCADERRGLLHAGTETGVYFVRCGSPVVAFQQLLVPVTDLQVKHGD